MQAMLQAKAKRSGKVVSQDAAVIANTGSALNERASVRQVAATARQLNGRGSIPAQPIVQCVGRPNGVQITNVRMGTNFARRHVASSNAEAETCANSRLDDDRQVIHTNSTATTGEWQAAVNANAQNLDVGSHEIAVTVNCRETSISGRTMAGNRTFTHVAPAATNKTLGVSVQNHHQYGWRVFVNHVH